MVKQYVGGRRLQGGATVVEVRLAEPVQPEASIAPAAFRRYPLPHVRYHSPDGFEWGYGGSGPADLALSILADHFGESPDLVLASIRSIWAPRTKAARLYQDFKWAFIANLTGPTFYLESREIEGWLEAPGNREVLAELEDRNAELRAIAALDAQEKDASH